MNTLFSRNIDYKKLCAKYGSPLLVLDKAAVRFQYKALSRALPGVTLHYALKPLPLPVMVDTLKKLNSSFDLASNGEVDLAKNAGIDPNNCIHTHPIKKESAIKYALDYGCKTFVYDSITELQKFIPFKNDVELLLRVSFPNPDAIVDLSRKFGCVPEEATELLEEAKKLGIKIRGLSFHVGSQVPNPLKHVEAIRICKKIIKDAAQKGIQIHTLDIGGGFPVDYVNAEPTDIYEFCAPIREELQGLPEDIKIIAEPGRFISAPAMLDISTVVGMTKRKDCMWYYLDDGVYCSYSGQIFDHVTYPKYAPLVHGIPEQVVLAGPTCDSIDVVAENIMLPPLKPGDIIVGRMMGAYTIATATEFNFIKKTNIVVVDLDTEDEILLDKAA